MTRRAVLSSFALLFTVLTGALLSSRSTPAYAFSLLQLSSDPFTNSTSQHRTQVEPDSFSFGSTIVTAFQSGRFPSQGSSGVGWATSTDGGASWSSGFLPGLTKYEGTGWYDRVSDPAVAYDAGHGVWIISTLSLIHRRTVSGNAVYGNAVLVSRSTDGGLTWGGPVVVAGTGDLDKNWIVCDNWPDSPHYGNCYVEYDDIGDGGRIYMATSTDGGLTWGTPLSPPGRPAGLGGQPVVQPNGTVVVPSGNSSLTSIIAFRSTNGGASWTNAVLVAPVSNQNVAGPFRAGPLPSADVDSTGRVYVVWSDCSFRVNCASNDMVMSTSLDGVSWSAVQRIPIDDVSSAADYFIPGVAVDPATSGAGAHVALAYYYYPVADCNPKTCQLYVGFISSADGGATWGQPLQLAGPMSLSWIALTGAGRMVGDYISVSFLDGKAFPIFTVAAQPGPQFDEAIYTVDGGIGIAASLGGVPRRSSPTQRVPMRSGPSYSRPIDTAR